MIDSHSTPAVTRDAGQAHRPQRRNFCQALVDGDGQEHGDEEKSEEQRDGGQHRGDLTKVRELEPAESLDELLVGDDVKLGMGRTDCGGCRQRADVWRRADQQHFGPVAIFLSAQPVGIGKRPGDR